MNVLRKLDLKSHVVSAVSWRWLLTFSVGLALLACGDNASDEAASGSGGANAGAGAGAGAGTGSGGVENGGASTGAGGEASGGSASDGTGGDASHAPTPGNVMVVIIDDFGVDSARGFAGPGDQNREYAQLPTLEEICDEGVQFDTAWSDPTCSPTRASLMTGRYGFRTGVQAPAGGNVYLPADEPTLPRILSHAGNDSHAHIGKWHLGTNPAIGGQDAARELGWSHYAGSLRGAVPDYEAWDKTINGVTSPSTVYATTETVNDALGWLQGREGPEPWLLWLAFNAPHAPFHLPPASLHHQSGLSGDAADIQANPAPYYRAMLEAMDTELGRLLAWVETNAPDTYVIILGDNGTPGQTTEAPYLRAHAKDTLFNGGLHVPLCIDGPQLPNAGRRESAPVNIVDVHATILRLMGVDAAATPTDRSSDSLSLINYLFDPAPTPERDFIYAGAKTTTAPWGHSVRNAEYHLVRYDEGSEHLFHVSQDPTEATDLLLAALSPEAQEQYTFLSERLDALTACEQEGNSCD